MFPSFNRVTSPGFGRVALLALLRKKFSRGTDLRHNLKLAIAVKFGTQLAFARAVGIHPIAINKICQGWKEPTAVERERIVTALKADSAWLFSSVTRIPCSEVTATGSPAEMTTKSQTRTTFDDTLPHATNAGQGKESPMHAQNNLASKHLQAKNPAVPMGAAARQHYAFPNSVFSHECKTCGARPWCWCVNSRGRASRTPHSRRSSPVHAVVKS